MNKILSPITDTLYLYLVWSHFISSNSTTWWWPTWRPKHVVVNRYVFHHLITSKLNLVVFWLYLYHIVILFNTTGMSCLKKSGSLCCKLFNNVTFKYSFYSASAMDFFREQLYVLNFVCNFRLRCIPLLFRTHHCVEYGSNKMMSSYCQKQTWTSNLWGQWAMFENTNFHLILLLCCMKFIRVVVIGMMFL